MVRARDASSCARRRRSGDPAEVVTITAAPSREQRADDEQQRTGSDFVTETCRFRETLATNHCGDRSSYYCETQMAVNGIHKHNVVTKLAIRQRHGVPYQVERTVCADCQAVLAEKPVKRAEAA